MNKTYITQAIIGREYACICIRKDLKYKDSSEVPYNILNEWIDEGNKRFPITMFSDEDLNLSLDDFSDKFIGGQI